MKAIESAAAPAPIGPYSQAIAAGGLLYCSGQVGIDPQQGRLVAGGDVEAQARQALLNLQAVIQEAGSSMRQVLKCGIFLTDMAHFAAVNEVYAQFFERPYPARETVAVRALPAGALVEISAVALLP